MIDLLIIGGGPGGYVAAIRARQLGLEVSLIEKADLGGTCLNRGCIPTKAYFQNAKALKTIQKSAEYSISLDNISFSLADAKVRKDEIVSNLTTGVKQLLKSNGVNLITGLASFVDNNTVEINGEKISAKDIIIATGSKPSHLPIKGIDNDRTITSDDILDITDIPQNLAIIGGGVIGLEFASIFNVFGSKVTIFEQEATILNFLDTELVKRMNVYLRRQGIDVNANTSIKEIVEQDKQVFIKATNKKGDIEVVADKILVAGGRSPQTDDLNLDKIGLVRDGKFIKVDDNFATNIPNIYAIGDVIGGAMLAHVASAEGVAVVEYLANIKEPKVNYYAVPSCIFTFPEIATVGLSEEEAKISGINYRVGKFPLAANGKAMTMGETDGLVKIIADDNDLIIGVHIIGVNASDLILEGAVLVENRLSLAEVTKTIHPHPTLGEAIAEAVMDVNGSAIHLATRKK
ncbi:MAG: dihydrolipoyl dehydrogenase [Syntrophomonadaceae bacterium]|nr:dihydrolipoyl dehydrogenase [Syntrophomonadaceae bacterium]